MHGKNTQYKRNCIIHFYMDTIRKLELYIEELVQQYKRLQH